MSGDDPVDNPTDGFYAAPGTAAHQRRGRCRRPERRRPATTLPVIESSGASFYSMLRKIKAVAIYPFTICTPIRHVGASGAGHAVKLLNNLMFGAINAITAEIFSIASSVGVSAEELYKTVADSGAATVSPLFRQLGPKIISGEYSPTFTVDLLHKDTALAMQMARQAEAYPMVGTMVETLHGLARTAGYGKEDTSAVFKLYAEALSTGGANEFLSE